MTERVALYLQDAHDLRDGLDYVRYAESRGFEAVWQAESRLVRDAIVPMAAYAAVTERIKVGSGVINNWTRNIGLLAATFLTLDDLASAIREPTRVCGELDEQARGRLKRKYKNVHLTSPVRSLRRPSYLAELAWERWQAGQIDDPASLAPIYLHHGDPIPE